MNTSPILIIGGNGFIGSYVAKSLVAKNCPVIATYRSKPSIRQKIRGVVYKKDFKLEPAQIKHIETVIFTPRPDSDTLAKTIDAFNTFPRLKKIVYISTFGLYPDSLRKQKETAKIVPVSEYQRKKYAEEISFRNFSKQKKLALCIARVSNPYGDIQDKQLIGKIIAQLDKKNKEFKINGDGTQLKDFIFIEDVAELISFIALRKQLPKYEVFNVCLGRGHSINEVIQILEEVSGKKLHFKRGILPHDEKINSIGDNTKILRASKYKIRYSLREGLEKTFQNYAKKR